MKPSASLILALSAALVACDRPATPRVPPQSEESPTEQPAVQDSPKFKTEAEAIAPVPPAPPLPSSFPTGEREWTSSDGQKITGSVAAHNGETVRFIRSDGREFAAMPVARLSDSDQARLAGIALRAGAKNPTMILRVGEATYPSVKVMRAEPDALVVMAPSGPMRQDFAHLSEDVRAAFGYDEKKADQARTAHSKDRRSGENEKARNIPGIMPVDVYLSLEKKGFSTEKDLGGSLKEWKSVQTSGQMIYQANTWGHTASSVHTIFGSVLFPKPDGLGTMGGDFLGFLASIQYDGSDPAKARDWVIQNIDQSHASTIIGDVIFEIGAPNKDSRTLWIKMTP